MASRTDGVGEEFDKLLAGLELKRKGFGFYALRHTFRTWADEVKDQHAIHRIMGHAIPGMSGIYVEEIGLDRLRAVVDHVRAKLFGDVPAATAILDRFLHHAEIITITGHSYRLKDRAASTPDVAKAGKPKKKTKTGCQEQQE